MDWLVIVTIGIFLLCIIVGIWKGAIRIGISLGATILTMLIVTFATPYISDAICKYTPIDDVIESYIVNTFSSKLDTSALLGVDLSGTPLDGMSEEEISSLDMKQLENLGISVEDLENLTGEIPKDTQISTIEGADIPEFLKNSLLENNNNEIYNLLGVNSFIGYIAAYVSRVAINLLSFLVVFILTRIIVSALLAAVDLISNLPVLNWVNRLAGAGVGVIFATLIVWVMFLILTILCTTGIGKDSFEQISSNEFLNFLYNMNPLLGKLSSF